MDKRLFWVVSNYGLAFKAMSDFESEDAESGDFSASEDEWNPEQTSGSDSASDFENATDSSPLKSAGSV